MFVFLGFFKPVLGWSRYRDANSLPSSPLADMATAPWGLIHSDSAAFSLVSLKFTIFFGRKEGYSLFNDTLNTFYLRLFMASDIW